VRHVHVDRQEATFAGVLASFFVEVRCGTQEQRPSVIAAQHAGEHSAAGLDCPLDLAALEDPDRSPARGVRDPERTFGIQATAVRRDDQLAEQRLEVPLGGYGTKLGPGTSVLERPVLSDVADAWRTQVVVDAIKVSLSSAAPVEVAA